MKHCIVIICLVLFLSKVSKGQDSNVFSINEFQISLNRTNFPDKNTEGRYGFGFGAYHSFLPDKKTNLVFGLEFNRTSQFKKVMPEGPFSHTTDLTYNLNCFSIPVGLRFNFGSKIKFFIETGGFADIVISSKRTGTMHTRFPFENNGIFYIYSDSKIDEEVVLSNFVGISVGLGLRIPISRFELILKPDYKFVLNKSYPYPYDILNNCFRINVGVKMN